MFLIGPIDADKSDNGLGGCGGIGRFDFGHFVWGIELFSKLRGWDLIETLMEET